MEIRYPPIGRNLGYLVLGLCSAPWAGCWGRVWSLPVCGGLARAPRGKGSMVPKKDWEEKLGMFA